ncbi:MAG: type II toxin-antitoxin system HipA family toxin, partial [Steroidobacteraceae bacterium]
GSLDVVTCGRYALETRSDGTALGRFVYGRSYRENARAVELDKFELPLRAGTFETVRLRGIFGALRDASPDAWGRRVMEKVLGRTDLTELEYLLHSPDDRIGALTFGVTSEPHAPAPRFNRALQLKALLRAAEELMDEEKPASAVIQQLDDLIQAGTSMGGARPKSVVEDDDGLWLAKFPMRDDRWNNAPVEAAMLRLAAECGIRAALPKVVKVAGKQVLLVKRFDRERRDGGYLRHRMVSALTVLQSDDDPMARGNWSYLRLADEIKRWVKDPDADLTELFRRVVFNALISNIDDHPRNHALIAPGAQWVLSPAYDLTPMPVVAKDKRDLALEAGTYNRYANRENLLSACARFRLSREEANAIIDEMKAIVGARWRGLAQKAGASKADCRTIEPAFNYPGFEYDPKDVLAAY